LIHIENGKKENGTDMNVKTDVTEMNHGGDGDGGGCG